MLQDFIHKDEAIKLHDEAVREYLNSAEFKSALNEYTLSIIPPKYENPQSEHETTFNMVVDQMREKVNKNV